MNTRRLWVILPLMVVVVLALFFARRLQLIESGENPELIPSVMLNQPAPDFVLHSLYAGQPDVTTTSLKGQVTLVNIFASWCVPCRIEHPRLARVKKAGIRIVALNYKDNADAARAWLQTMGDPFDAIASDTDGRVAIDFGAYGVPESYLLDKNGVIRFKQTGPLTDADIDARLLPMARELMK